MFKVIISSKDDSVMIVQTGRYCHVERITINGETRKYPNMTFAEAIKLYKSIEKNR